MGMACAPGDCFGPERAAETNNVFKTLTELRHGFCNYTGHPEFTPDIVTKVIGVREELGVFSPELAQASRLAAAEHDAGVYIGRVLLGIIGVM